MFASTSLRLSIPLSLRKLLWGFIKVSAKRNFVCKLLRKWNKQVKSFVFTCSKIRTCSAIFRYYWWKQHIQPVQQVFRLRNARTKKENTVEDYARLFSRLHQLYQLLCPFHLSESLEQTNDKKKCTKFRIITKRNFSLLLYRGYDEVFLLLVKSVQFWFTK